MARGFGGDERDFFSIDRLRFRIRSTEPEQAPESNTCELFIKNEDFKHINSSGKSRFIGEKVAVTGNDAQVDYLFSKIVVGTGITKTEINDGGVETLKLEVNNVVGSSRFAVAFGRNAIAATVYLDYFSGISSFDSPLVLAEPVQLVAVSISTKTNSTGTASIRKNGVEITTISLSASQANAISGLALNLIVLDEISIYVPSGSLDRPVVTLFMKVLL